MVSPSIICLVFPSLVAGGRLRWLPSGLLEMWGIYRILLRGLCVWGSAPMALLAGADWLANRV